MVEGGSDHCHNMKSENQQKLQNIGKIVKIMLLFGIVNYIFIISRS